MLISRLAVPALLLALVVLVLPAGAAQAGVDCGCATTGDYVSPIEPVGLTDSVSGGSPNGKYALAAVDGAGSIHITIDRVSPPGQVLSIDVPPGSGWGFSPDDDRFSYHYLTGSIETVRLFDLTATHPATWIWEGGANPVASETVFSPHGVSALYVAIDDHQQSFLTLVDAHTGAVSYQASPIVATAPGDSADAYALQAWGFSPDSDDRSFVYASSLGPQWVDLALVNLSAGTVVHNETILSIAAFWQFSPCGDVMAIVNQANTTQEVTELRRTSDGTRLAQRTDTFGSAVEFNPAISFGSTATEHVATVGVTPHNLAPNVAGIACPASPSLQDLRLSPDSVASAAPTTGILTLSAPAGAGGVAVALTYIPAWAYGPASVTIPAGHTGASFAITTNAVSSPTLVTVRATLAADFREAVLAIIPVAAELDTLALSSNDVLGGGLVSATVNLTQGAPPESAVVVLTSSNPLAATVPASVVLAPGDYTADANVTTPAVDTRDSTILSASYRGRTRTQKLVVRPVTLQNLRLSMHCVLGGDSLYAQVDLDGPAGARGAHIALAGDQASVTLPDTCVIPPGASYAQFGVATHAVAAQVVAHLTASWRGVTVGDSLTVFEQMDVVVRDLGTLLGFFQRPGDNCCGYYEFLSVGHDLNNLGQVVGTSSIDGRSYGAMRWSAGSMDSLGFLFPTDGAATAAAINDAGTAVGESNGAACVFDSGTVNAIALVDGPASDINRAGHIVGGPVASLYALGSAWFYDGTATILTSPPGSRWSSAAAVNDSDVVVGTVTDTLHVTRPFRWTAATGMVALAVPDSATNCYALDINNAGAIVGYCQIGSYDHAVSWQGTEITRVAGQGTRFVGVNNTGLTLGSVNWLPAIWNGATPYVIQNSLQGNCGVNLVEATAINDQGQISGTANVSAPGGDGSSAQHAVLLTSLPTAPWMQGLTAVEASGQVVTAAPTRIMLLWMTREVVLAGTLVQRTTDEVAWESVGAPTVNGSNQLAFVDGAVTPGHRYGYRLAVLEGGVTRYLGSVSARTPNLLAFAIQGFRPNPARAGDVTIAFSLPVTGDAVVELFDVNGRRAMSHLSRGLPAGAHELPLPEAGSLAPGLYFVRLTQAARSRTARLAILR